MYFRGDTELHDLGEPCTSLLCPCSYGSVIDALGLRTDTHLLNRMPETTLRCLGVDHRKGNGARDRSLSETSKLVGQTIGRALSGGTKPFVPNAEEGDKVPGGPVRAHTLFASEILRPRTPFPLPLSLPCTLPLHTLPLRTHTPALPSFGPPPRGL